MKISLNWLREYIDLADYSSAQIADILTEIGLEVEGTELHESVKGGLKGIVVGQVIKCHKHPNADRLSLTEVDLGNGQAKQIVCGAPNVAIGQKVMVATVGTTLYDKEGKSFKIKRGKIRGEISEGMICAEDELGLGDDHSGIIVLPDDVAVGTLGRDYYQVTEDTVFEIALTPNRSDATCHIGVAHDLRAALAINYDGAIAPMRRPNLSTWEVDHHSKTVSVSVENAEACPRYAGVSISEIKIGESPSWLRERLTSIGVRPINNVVDVTNFVLHEMGQPLHAFDMKKIASQKIVVKTLAEGTSFTTLDEQARTLSEQDLMICDGDSNGLCIAGVFGGVGSGVTDETSEIFLESAHFNAKWIRRSSGRHLLFTDAAKVFEKGSDPNICVEALKRAALLIKELTGGKISSEIVDVYPVKITKREVPLRFAQLKKLVGVEIPKDKVFAILSELGIEIKREDEDGIIASVPTNKVDVTREADLIEEILRIFGFNNVPLPAGMHLKVKVDDQVEALPIQNRVAEFLVSQGFNEMMALSLVDKKHFAEADALVRINNTSNLNLEVMRPSMLTTSLEVVRHNNNRQQNNLRLFEFGFTYHRDQSEIKEHQTLALIISGWHEDHWLAQDLPGQQPFYAMKAMVTGILEILGIRKFKSIQHSAQELAWGLEYTSKGKELVRFGKVKSGHAKKFEVKSDVYYACFDWDYILTLIQPDQLKVAEISRFPVVRRDLAFVLSNSTTYAQLENLLLQSGQPLVRQIELFDIYRDKSLGTDQKSYAIALTFGSDNKTLSDQEIDSVMTKIVMKAKQDLNATLR